MKWKNTGRLDLLQGFRDEGYHYVAVWASDFELVGKDRWEGVVHSKETQLVTFKLKLKKIDQLTTGSGFIQVNLGLAPFKGITNQGFPTAITVRLKQIDDIKKYFHKRGKEANIERIKKMKLDHPVYYDSTIILPNSRTDSSSLRGSKK